MKQVLQNMIKVGILIVVINLNLFGQIALLPPVVYIDPASNSGSTVLQNQTNTPKEVLIDFQYGFISYDKDGEAYLDTADMRFQDYNLQPFIKVFPKKVLIPPFGQQTIRFFVNTGGRQLKDGTYWVRINVQSRDTKSQIDSLQGKTGAVQVDFRMNVRTNSIVVYPKGNTTTGLKIVNHNFQMSEETLDLWVEYEKTGNSPFWGMIDIEVKDEKGNLISTEKIPTQIYHSGKIKYKFYRNYFRKGKYTFNFKVSGERSEIPENFKIKFSPITREFVYNMP